MTFDQMMAAMRGIAAGTVTMPKPDPISIDVVWAGKDSLIPDRAEQPDPRLKFIPSYDIEEVDRRCYAAPIKETIQ